MTLGIFARTFSGSEPGIVLACARQAGFTCVQYNMASSGLDSLPSEIPGVASAAVHAAASETGVEIAAISATYNMIHPDPRERARGRAAFSAIAAAAPAMGTQLLTVCTGTRDAQNQWRYHPENATDVAWEELLAEFQLLLPVARACGVRIGVEPEPGNVVSNARRARRLLDTVRDDGLCIVIDAANLDRSAAAQQRYLLAEAMDLLGPAIALAHVKPGVLDYPFYIAALQRAGFQGAVVAHGFPASEAAGIAAFLSRMII